MSKTLFLMSGDYGAGKTYLAHTLTTPSNTVALASGLRVELMKCFRGDMRICSIKQEDKNSIFGGKVLESFIKRERVKGVEKQLFLTFQQMLGEQKDFNTLTVRDVIGVFGAAGRSCNRYYWIKKTISSLELCEAPILCVDDVRFINELDYLKKWSDKNKYNCLHLFVGAVDDGYDNRELYNRADYVIDWRK